MLFIFPPSVLHDSIITKDPEASPINGVALPYGNEAWRGEYTILSNVGVSADRYASMKVSGSLAGSPFRHINSLYTNIITIMMIIIITINLRGLESHPCYIIVPYMRLGQSGCNRQYIFCAVQF